MKNGKKKAERKIVVKGANEHNLKNLSFELPRNKLVVFTGVSGSGKSSLVFDTIYSEGQRRYVESLSSYARQFLERMNKPDVELITGISPAVAIEQKSGSRNSRSTVGTTTEVYDYLRLFWARVGKTICFNCGKVVTKATTGVVSDYLEAQPEGTKFYLTFPVQTHEGRSVKEELELLKKKGFFRIILDNKLIDLNEDKIESKKNSEAFVVVERFKIKKGAIREKLADSIEVTFKEGENKLSLINIDTNQRQDFNKFFECCGIRYEEPEPRFFSFNNPFGACPVCQGFSKVVGIDMKLVVPAPDKTLADGAIAPWRTVTYGAFQRDLIRSAAKYKIPINVPWKDLTDDQREKVINGTKDFNGISKYFEMLEQDTYKMHIRILLSKYKSYTTCHACKGSRLRREALQVKVNNHSIYDVVRMPISKSLQFFKELKLSDYEMKVADRVLDEIIKRLNFLNDVGIGYLTLDRLSNTLSGGETQRINLTTSLGSALVGTLYVLDEPSIGLHPRDNDRLIRILKNLRDIGNSVLIVEHDAEMMREADLIVDMGPKAGKDGGEIIAIGTYDEIKANPKSLTGQYLSGSVQIPIPQVRRKNPTRLIKIKGASENNLKNIDVEIPLNKFVVITGVSGSGKSTLIHDVLYSGIASNLGMSPNYVGAYSGLEGYNYINDVVIVDQSPIGKSPRSNPASYIKAYEIIREMFASTPQAKARGYMPGYFSFNIPGGRCETCQGEGYIKVEMQFLADLYLECEDCKGTRFKKEVREITFRGKNLIEVLNMTVDEALKFFDKLERVNRYLRVLQEVGLGYIQLGQPSNTLSGGEAQRIKLASHLVGQADNKNVLFIFDEPTTGLHFNDIKKLLNCFDLLLERNNSVVIIEHNLDVIKYADYIIDLGPEAGEDGGEIVAAGTPEEIADNENSITGRYLKEYLNK